jgi:hypothetical protein
MTISWHLIHWAGPAAPLELPQVRCIAAHHAPSWHRPVQRECCSCTPMPCCACQQHALPCTCCTHVRPCSAADLRDVYLQVSGVRVFLEMRAELATDTAWASAVSCVYTGTDASTLNEAVHEWPLTHIWCCRQVTLQHG